MEKPKPDREAIASSDLFSSLLQEIEDAKCRRLNLIRDSQDARLKVEVVEEYIWKLEGLRDKLPKENSKDHTQA